MTGAGSFSYVLPIAAAEGPSAELTEYLQQLSECCELIIVDGSPPAVFDAAHRVWGSWALHVPPDRRHACVMGKVTGVLTGLDLVSNDAVVIADDDVRYSPRALQQIVAALGSADLVVPQNYFDPLPWHARWDTARILLNRATGGDFPGTLGVRATRLRKAGGYDGDVMFENLELMRTIEAAGGTLLRMPGLYVRRLPPTTRHFLSQRVRQAYDELARPHRLGVSLIMIPLSVALTLRRRALAALIPVTAIAIAEVGRRREDGRRYFPPTSSLLAPLWIIERAVCAWIAVGARLRGGVKYRGNRIRCAAHSTADLRHRHEQHSSCLPGAERSAARPGHPVGEPLTRHHTAVQELRS